MYQNSMSRSPVLARGITEILKSSMREKARAGGNFDLEEAIKPHRRHQLPNRAPLAPGDHKLICGDATDREAVQRLTGQSREQWLHRPPYNVDYGNHGVHLKRQAQDANDNLAGFEHSWRKPAGTSLNSPMASTSACPLRAPYPAEDLVSAGDTVYIIIWAKKHLYHRTLRLPAAIRPILYGWREGANTTGAATGPGHVCTWRTNNKPLHPTMKPLALVERAIQNSSGRGQGTRPVLGQQHPDRCERTEEPAPEWSLNHLVDITRMRWEAFSGRSQTV